LRTKSKAATRGCAEHTGKDREVKKIAGVTWESRVPMEGSVAPDIQAFAQADAGWFVITRLEIAVIRLWVAYDGWPTGDVVGVINRDARW
jgi:hypothetical protein